MASPTPPPPLFLPVSALSLELDAYVSVTASMHAGFADTRATFECSFSSMGPDVGFLVLAGVEPLLDALERVKLKTDELAWLESLGAVDAAAKKKLADMRFACDVDAAIEGSVVFPGEPVLTVEGPYWQAQLVSALVRSSVQSATLVATRAARCVVAADGAEVIEHTAATAHRLGGNALVARSAFVGGAAATTCALAARRYRLPVRASLPPRFSQGAGSARAITEAWMKASQDRAIMRIDWRDPVASITALVEAVKKRSQQASWRGGDVAVEIGGGDHLEIARAAVAAFAKAGLEEPVLVASGGLDELRIADLRRQRAPLSAYIVSSLGVDDGTFCASYEMAAIEVDGQWTPRMSQGRTVLGCSDPGRKVVVRYADADGHPLADVAHATGERLSAAKDVRFIDRSTGFPVRLQGASTSATLLGNVMRAGKRVSATEAARDIRERSVRSVLALHERHRRLRAPAPYLVGATAAVDALKHELLPRTKA